jgi:phosphohistidine phosphatase
VMVVGHNPNITAFLVHLISGHNGPNSARNQPRIRLRKGSLARVSLQRGPATLQGLLDPRVVRALYATSTKSSRRKTSRK